MVFPAPAGGSILVPSYTKTLDTVAAKPFLETLTDTMQPQDSLVHLLPFAILRVLEDPITSVMYAALARIFVVISRRYSGNPHKHFCAPI